MTGSQRTTWTYNYTKILYFIILSEYFTKIRTKVVIIGITRWSHTKLQPLENNNSEISVETIEALNAIENDNYDESTFNKEEGSSKEDRKGKEIGNINDKKGNSKQEEIYSHQTEIESVMNRLIGKDTIIAVSENKVNILRKKIEEKDATIREKTDEISRYRNIIEKNMRQINALMQKVESMTNKTIIAGRVERDAKMIKKEK